MGKSRSLSDCNGVPLAYALTLAIALSLQIGASGDDAAFLGAILTSIAPPFIFPVAAFIACVAGMIVIRFRPKYLAYAKPLRYCLFFWGPMIFLALILAFFFLIF